MPFSQHKGPHPRLREGAALRSWPAVKNPKAKAAAKQLGEVYQQLADSAKHNQTPDTKSLPGKVQTAVTALSQCAATEWLPTLSPGPGRPARPSPFAHPTRPAHVHDSLDEPCAAC
ncbi:hypothetical protein CFP65_0891 [Kitasatospora sp. MMS16-BH015]|uniref:hypothetical protein n=1 Tax=Kitasatospora sp. MMS16-BH015 TaxID=2018025 RepID=UPI000CA2829E|nr:hypothetical protein [Kitasatospora sp. MMS16-BH015]AUG75813.1 hypothetical protein CFP65_0891 [Kitasatospora sp. MMS16-BH015]